MGEGLSGRGDRIIVLYIIMTWLRGLSIALMCCFGCINVLVFAGWGDGNTDKIKRGEVTEKIRGRAACSRPEKLDIPCSDSRLLVLCYTKRIGVGKNKAMFPLTVPVYCFGMR